MPRPTFLNGAFDPNLCPLLQGLSPEEQRLRMETDPLIRACAGSVAKGEPYPARCRTEGGPARPVARKPAAAGA